MSLRSEFAGVVLKICKLTHRQHTQASKWTRGLALSLHEKQALVNELLEGPQLPAADLKSLPAQINRSPPNKDGVLKGTRLAAMDPRSGGDIFLYHQNWQCQPALYHFEPRTRVAGTLPLDDAMLHTPIASTYTDSNGIITWWLFYLDKSNVIQNIYSRGNPTDWQRGNIGSKRYTVPTQSSIAFEEDDRWSDGSVFPNTDGHGGASVWSLNSYAYLFTLRNTQTIDLWWQDYNSQSVDRNSWQLGPSSHAAVMANASMCGQFVFAYQGAKEWIQGNNFTGTRPELVR
ncbi:hypothetical protein BDBG_08166 [Blastomyces gilchristii SLH14081]|uniref:Fucose-specific lectin n=1 Tax=Blastomyces gilchristii (strain SLH14081) TaxID=559298 RepID=A0A179UXR3_BLAGS|nr:uncharacterized protein BDBG_08166 [Blastomyces gilchristii SLH14081]OAT12874.1 hypothetical protein BDBG_08166 [Blastomyces gilchristii SLH14081]